MLQENPEENKQDQETPEPEAQASESDAQEKAEAPPEPEADAAPAPAEQPEQPPQEQKFEGMKLEAQKLVKVYRGRRVVNEVSLKLHPGEIVGLLGPNGAGKSTTFYMLTGLISPNKGRIFLNGRNVSRLAMYKRSRAGVGYLPQEPSIFRKLTVAENLLLILEARGISVPERKARVDQLLKKLNIERLRKQKGYVLSGGERRRAEIARALATEPTYLLLDEPFTGIDPISVQELQDLLRDLVKNPEHSNGRPPLGILITDHNVRETLEITDRSYIMYDGNILISGVSDEILQDPDARKYYLGERFRM